ncbi:MAG TPA: guanylate kinase [Mariprofundaceae bacterium]|nr:guanylate kinase [Mariprofundaceae bacterium]
MSGRLFIVSGPSGAGKSSLCAALLRELAGLKLSISCTTRAPRPGEADGREYHFLSIEAFEGQRDAGAFLEWANVHGNLYGTRQRDVEAILDEGDDVLLEIDWQGAAQVAAKMPEAVRIFILPPSVEELRRRLSGRGQDSHEVIERRVAAAETEMAHAGEAHYRVVNLDFDAALAELKAIFRR